MRIVTLDQRDRGWRAGYRWADDPVAAPRLLVDSADIRLDRLRETLERDFFGEAMRPEVYRIVALVQDNSELETIRTAFSGFDVVGVPRNEPTTAILQRWMAPDAAFDPVLALTYWQSEPPDFAALFDQLDSGFIAPFAEYTAEPTQMCADFANIRASIRSAVVGQSARALREVCAQLTGVAVRVPVAPSQAVIHTDSFCGLSLDVIDWRAPNAAAQLNSIPLRILAAASDPGVGAGELSALQGAEQALIGLVNNHAAPEDYAAMKGYIQAQLSAIQVVDADQIAAAGRAALGRIVRQRLFLWLDTHFEKANAPDKLREPLENLRRLIAAVSGH